MTDAHKKSNWIAQLIIGNVWITEDQHLKESIVQNFKSQLEETNE